MTEPTLFDDVRANGSRNDYPAALRQSFWSVASYKKYGDLTPPDHRYQINAMFDEIDRLRARVTELEARP